MSQKIIVCITISSPEPTHANSITPVTGLMWIQLAPEELMAWWGRSTFSLRSYVRFIIVVMKIHTRNRCHEGRDDQLEGWKSGKFSLTRYLATSGWVWVFSLCISSKGHSSPGSGMFKVMDVRHTVVWLLTHGEAGEAIRKGEAVRHQIMQAFLCSLNCCLSVHSIRLTPWKTLCICV